MKLSVVCVTLSRHSIQQNAYKQLDAKSKQAHLACVCEKSMENRRLPNDLLPVVHKSMFSKSYHDISLQLPPPCAKNFAFYVFTFSTKLITPPPFMGGGVSWCARVLRGVESKPKTPFGFPSKIRHTSIVGFLCLSVDKVSNCVLRCAHKRHRFGFFWWSHAGNVRTNKTWMNEAARPAGGGRSLQSFKLLDKGWKVLLT